jgi:hypothetical protein
MTKKKFFSFSQLSFSIDLSSQPLGKQLDLTSRLLEVSEGLIELLPPDVLSKYSSVREQLIASRLDATAIARPPPPPSSPDLARASRTSAAAGAVNSSAALADSKQGGADAAAVAAAIDDFARTMESFGCERAPSRGPGGVLAQLARIKAAVCVRLEALIGEMAAPKGVVETERLRAECGRLQGEISFLKESHALLLAKERAQGRVQAEQARAAAEARAQAAEAARVEAEAQAQAALKEASAARARAEALSQTLCDERASHEADLAAVVLGADRDIREATAAAAREVAERLGAVQAAREAEFQKLWARAKDEFEEQLDSLRREAEEARARAVSDKTRLVEEWARERSRLLDAQEASQTQTEQLVRAAQEAQAALREQAMAAEALRTQNRRLGAALRRSARSMSVTTSASSPPPAGAEGGEATSCSDESLLENASFLDFAQGLEAARAHHLVPAPDGKENLQDARGARGSRKIDLQSAEFEEARRRLHESVADVSVIAPGLPPPPLPSPHKPKENLASKMQPSQRPASKKKAFVVPTAQHVKK